MDRDEDGLLQYAGSPTGVGDNRGADLVQHTESAPRGVSDVQWMPTQKMKPRSRPNRGRVKRTNRNPLPEPPLPLFRELNIPIPPYLKNLPYTPVNWRRGPGYQAWHRAVFAMWGTECHLCGHGNARTADHLIPLSMWSNQPYDPRLARPAHGIEGCPTCGVKCNSSRGNKLIARQIKHYKPPAPL